MAEKYIAPGHRLSDEDWAAVTRRAEEVRREVADSAQGGAAGPGGIVVDMTAKGVASKKYFGVSGIPTQLLVLHSGECPLRAGYAVSLSEWSCGTIYPAPPVASWQRFIDPVHRVRLIPDHLGAWHASEANVNSIGWEQAGYARFTRDEWLTPDGRTQMELLAFDMAEVAVREGIPARWLTNDEVWAATHGNNRSIKGFCLHRQIDPDTRTDPGNGYPYDLLMERIRFYMSGGSEAEEPATPVEEDEMITLATDGKSPNVWAGNGIFRVPVWTMDTLKARHFLNGAGAAKYFKDGEVQTIPDLNAIGMDVMALFGKDFYGKPLPAAPTP